MSTTVLQPVRLTKPSRPAVRLAVDVALAVGLFWAASAAYRGSTGHVQSADSAYSLVTAETLLKTGSADLSGYVPPGADLPYQLTRHPARPGGVYYGYPLGSSVLSLPWVWDFARRGLSTTHPDGTRNAAIEDHLQLRVAARVSAAVVVLFYVLCRFWCPPAVSLLLAVGFAFGSPVWSTLSRALWSHTWMVFWLTAAVVLLAARRAWGTRGFTPGYVVSGFQPSEPVASGPKARGNIARGEAPGPGWRVDLLFGVLIGTALFWVVFVRAHGVLSAAAVGAYLLLHHRRTLLFTVLAGGLWSAVLVLLSLHHFGTPTPPSVYAPDTIDGRDVLDRFFWLMLSPSRGLIVYCPYLLAVGGILVAFRRHLTSRLRFTTVWVAGAESSMPRLLAQDRGIEDSAPATQTKTRPTELGLLLPAGLAVAAHTAVFSCYNGWHAGSSYGPRYFADVLPWFVLATAVACRGLLNARAAGERRRVVLASAALVLGFAWGGWVHGRGANSVKAWLWNERAKAVGQEGAVKEWRHPQFLCGRTFDVNPDGSIRDR